MRNLALTLIAAGLCLPAAALAEPRTRTMTIDTPRYEGSRTVTRDREAGTVSRDSEVTRRSDGATRSRDYSRERTANGYRAEGSVTRFNGETFDYSAAGRRTPNGFVRRQGLRNSDGDLIAGRRVAVRQRAGGSIVRRSTSIRPGRRR